jgi:hypothetical protein
MSYLFIYYLFIYYYLYIALSCIRFLTFLYPMVVPVWINRNKQQLKTQQLGQRSCGYKVHGCSLPSLDFLKMLYVVNES